MIRHVNLLYGFITVVGSVLVALFFPSPMAFPFMNLATSAAYSFIGEAAFSGTATWVLFTCFCSVVGVVFLTAGLCKIGGHYLRNNQNNSAYQLTLAGDSGKHSRLFGCISLLGIVFLGTFITMGYLGTYSEEVTGFFMSTYPFSGFLMLFVFLVGGTGLLTVGVCGIVRQNLRSQQNLFTILVAILVPSSILMSFSYVWISSLTVVF